MDVLSRTGKEVAFVGIALLLAFGIYQTVGTALGTNVPVVAVTSPSMEPTLERGDMVLVKGVPFSEIEEGDIIVFDTGSPCLPVPIIHRVVDIDGNGLTTKGDSNPSQLVICHSNGRCSQTFDVCPEGTELNAIEEGITPDQVKGVVAFKVPYLGHVKLVPTCIYLKAARESVPDTLCP